MKVIDELWYGNLRFNDREVPKASPLRESMNRAARAEEKLVEALDDEQQQILEDLMDKHMNLTADLECDAFGRGVRFGALMMIEILGKHDE